MLWKVRISPRRKIALGAVFSVTVFTIVFAIARVSLMNSHTWHEDMTWLYNWSNVETYAGKDVLRRLEPSLISNTAALIVCSLGSFRSLFKSQDSAKTPPPPVGAPHTIGGSPKKRKLDSFAHMFTSSIAKTLETSESQHEFVELKEPVTTRTASISGSSAHGSESMEFPTYHGINHA